MKSIFLAIAIPVALVVLIALIFTVQKLLSDDRSDSNTETQDEQRNAESRNLTREDFAWNFSDAGVHEETGAPLTVVTLLADGEAYDLGTHVGSCAEIEGSGWTYVEGEISGVICWFAGGGIELGVFEAEDGTFVVRQGIVEEGSAESEGFRGDFEHFLTLRSE